MDNADARTVSNNVNRGGNEVIVDIDKMLEELEPPPSSECCIYWVPIEVRNENEKAYIPRIVSIGPFHHNNKILKSTEQVKQRYVKRFVLMNWNSSSMKYFDFVKNWEADICKCYSERIEMNSNEFNIMVLVNSCFIIQFLIPFYNYWESDDDGSLFLTLEMKDNIYRDLILLENQLIQRLQHKVSRDMGNVGVSLNSKGCNARRLIPRSKLYQERDKQHSTKDEAIILTS
ncbi:hypothetical protein LguiB_027664 [Lonicera macranthoides]